MADKLAFLYAAAPDRDLVNNVIASGGTRTYASTPMGIGVTTVLSNIAGARFSVAPLVTSDGAGTGDYTMSVLAGPPSRAAVTGLISTDALSQAQTYILANGNTAAGTVTGQLAFAMFDGTLGSAGVTTTLPTDGQYHLYTGVRRGTSVFLYIDGTLANSATGITARNLIFSGQGVAVGGLFAYGSFGEPTPIPFGALWNRALSSSEITQLAQNPYQLFSQLSLRTLPIPGISLAAVPAAVATLTAGLSTQITMACTPAGLASLTAALSTQITLAMTPAAQSTLAPGLLTQISMALSAAAQAALSPALTTQIAMAMAPAAVASVSPALTTQISLAMSSAAQATLTPTLLVQLSLAMAATATASFTAALSTQITFAAAPAALATLTPTLAGPALLAMTPAAQASLSAALATQVRFSMAAVAQATLQGTMYAPVSMSNSTKYYVMGQMRCLQVSTATIRGYTVVAPARNFTVS
jgi:hypothetical protein